MFHVEQTFLLNHSRPVAPKPVVRGTPNLERRTVGGESPLTLSREEDTNTPGESTPPR